MKSMKQWANRGSIYIFFLLLLIIQLAILTNWCNKKAGYYWDEYYTMDNVQQVGIRAAERYFQVSENEWNSIDRLQDCFRVNPEESILESPFWFVKGRLLNWNMYHILMNIFAAKFAPNVVGKWIYLVFNLICFALTQILILFTTKGITKKPEAGFVAAMIYGFCGEALAMTTFIRHYNFAICMLMLFLFLHVCMWNRKSIFSFLIMEMLAFAALYMAVLGAPAMVGVAAGVVLSYLILLLKNGKGIKFLCYGGPVVAGGIFVMTYMGMFDALLHPENYAQEGGAWASVTGAFTSLTPAEFVRRMKFMLTEIYIPHFTGTKAMFAVLVIALLIYPLGKIFTKTGRQNLSITFRAFPMLSLLTTGVVFHLVLSLVMNLDIERYNCQVFPLLAMLTAACLCGCRKTDSPMSVLNIDFRAVYGGIVAMILSIVNLCHPVETYVLPYDAQAIKTLAEYKGINSVVIQTGRGMDDVTQREAVIFGDPSTSLWYTRWTDKDVLSLEGVEDAEILLWIYGGEMDEEMKEYFISQGFETLEPIAVTHMSWVYDCKR